MSRTASPVWSCTLPLTVRREGASADHYFLINPGPATTAFLHAEGVEAWQDVLEDTSLPSLPGGCAVPVQAGSAAWVRAVHTR